MNVETAGAVVRSIHNPSKVGISTGRVRRHHGLTFVDIRYASGDLEPIPVDELEIAPTVESRSEAFARQNFSAPVAVARSIITEKIRGQLTDVLYSMGSGQATFYPHQFKPVLSFLGSPLGRILIADEVGLGKTVEAIYVWRELQAREAARRLLVVCPAVLRTKWLGELRERFSIDASIVTARELLRLCRDAERDSTKAFVAIAGIESIRARRAQTAVPERGSARAELNAFLLENEARQDFALFDLVIVDEAHYMRNPETANHQTGQVLAGAAGHLALLTATPIQIGSENLFHLLRIIDPDRFTSFEAFESVRRANTAVTRALNAARRARFDPEELSQALRELGANRFFQSDTLVQSWRERMPEAASPDDRARLGRQLEERSLLANVLTRTRKRDVMENRVVREPKVVPVQLRHPEQAIYQAVTTAIRERARGADTVNTLALIARQRQLASSIPAALASWAAHPATSDLLSEGLDLITDADELPDLAAEPLVSELSDSQIAQIEAIDTKFEVFRTFLRRWLDEHPNDKIVVFSFFRGTLQYLRRRLTAEGLGTALIQGGMGETKDQEILRFADPCGPNVLLSSEVGSEGIDLQFARVLVNYDLPWNPMRVEQRIGRIDRLGQTSDVIKIVSLVLEGTIEDVILERLHNRIGVFEDSIGDIEEILGESVEDLLVEYFRGSLSEEQVAERLEQNALAAAEQRRAVEQLEDEAPELAGSMDFILSSIRQGHDAGRWIRPEDVRDFLQDFLLEHYPGSRIETDHATPNLYRLQLSPSARADLAAFTEQERLPRNTRLTTPGVAVAVVFEPGLQTRIRPRPELLDITHPIVAMARSAVAERTGQIEPVAAFALPSGPPGVPPGAYVFATDLWRLVGLRRDIRLQSLVLSVPDGSTLDAGLADKLVDEALRFGGRVDPADFADVHRLFTEMFSTCERELEHRFLAERHTFRQENRRRVEQARLLVHDRSAARLARLREQLDRQRQSTDPRQRRAAPMTQGRIDRLEADRDQRLARIQATEDTETTRRPVAGGIIIVEGVGR